MSSFGYRGILLIALLGYCGVTATSQGAEVVTTKHLDERVEKWLIHPQSGLVFALIHTPAQVAVLDSDGQEVKRLDVGAMPVDMVVKGDLLVVASKGVPSLDVFDINKLSLVERVLLPVAAPACLCCSKKPNGLVYAYCNMVEVNSRYTEVGLFRVDLTKKPSSVDNIQRIQRMYTPVRATLSDDGSTMVHEGRFHQATARISLWKLDEQHGTLQQMDNPEGSFGPAVACPTSSHWIFGNTVYPLDASRKLRSFPAELVAVHPNLDLSVALSPTSVGIKQFSDLKSLDGLLLREASRRTPSRADAPAPDPFIGFDLKHDRAFVARGSTGYWITLDTAIKKASPLAWVQMPDSAAAIAGRTLELSPTIGGTGHSGLELRATLAKEPLDLQDGNIRWTPTAGDLGEVLLDVILQSPADKRIIDTRRCTISVSFPHLDLQFNGDKMKLSPNGERLLIVGAKGRMGSSNRDVPCMAVVDVKSRNLIASREFTESFGQLELDDEAVYVVPQGNSMVVKYDHKLEEVGRYLTRNYPARLVILPEGMLAIVGQRSMNRTMEILDTASMQLDTTGKSAYYSKAPQNQMAELEPGLVVAGCRLMDEKTGQMLRCLQGQTLPMLTDRTFVRTDDLDAYRAQIFQYGRGWGFKFNGETLTDGQGSSVFNGRLGGGASILSRKFPVVYTVRIDVGHRLTPVVLDVRALPDVEVVSSQIVHRGPAPEGASSSSNFPGPRMVEVGSDLACFFYNKLLFLPLPIETLEKLPVPPHFSERQVSLVDLNTAGENHFNAAVEGDAGGVKYSLAVPRDGVAIDEKSGQITISSAVLWKRFLTRAGTTYTDPRTRFPKSGVVNASVYYSHDPVEFERVFGKPLPDDRYAVQLPLVAQLNSPNGARDSIMWSVVLLGPRSDVEAAMKKERARQAEQIKKQHTAAMERQKEQARQKQEAATKEASADERLDKLEQRMRRLEAAVDSILKKLDER